MNGREGIFKQTEKGAKDDSGCSVFLGGNKFRQGSSFKEEFFPLFKILPPT